jgi:mobilization protein NikA
MPRPVKEDPRDRFKSFRFTAGEITRLEARARASGRSLSDYVRAALLDGTGSRAGEDSGANGAGATLPARPRSEDYAMRALTEQMRKVGVNLNQIAKRMNEQRMPPPRELAMLIDDIRAYVRQAQEL